MRLEGWEQQLAAFVEANQSRPFAYGTHDCALYVCGAIQVLAGVDVAEPFRGKYDSVESAAAVIGEFCGGDLEALARKIAQEHEFEEIPPLLAGRGDVVVVMCKGGRGPTLGFVGMNGFTIMGTFVPGYKPFTLRDAKRAWRIQ